MSLPESIVDYQGQLLCFEPWHGWGWFHLGAGGGKVPLAYDEVDRAGAGRAQRVGGCVEESRQTSCRTDPPRD
jgi:hypothetical protein